MQRVSTGRTDSGKVRWRIGCSIADAAQMLTSRKPMFDALVLSSAKKSSVRARIEHFFAH